MTNQPKPAGLAAVDTIILLMEDFTDEQKELLVNCIHDIIADVIDSAALHVRTVGHYREQGDWADTEADDLTDTVNDYVANHYGIEEFGL